ncbi:hypothetical protein B0H13DRAFT_2398437 [Mycena leptocephala]|nr:hypothetical protein B0H13DRAFT_2398437 [Mycena leptocephala]
MSVYYDFFDLTGLHPGEIGDHSCTLYTRPSVLRLRRISATGKAGADILAARLLRSNGPIENWHRPHYQCFAYRSGILHRERPWAVRRKAAWQSRKVVSDVSVQIDLNTSGKLPNDSTVENELYRMLHKLEAHREAEKERAIEPSFGDFNPRVSAIQTPIDQPVDRDSSHLQAGFEPNPEASEVFLLNQADYGFQGYRLLATEATGHYINLALAT